MNALLRVGVPGDRFSMPLTAKGREILASLEKQYGPEKGKQVLYAGKNKGTFSGIDAAVQAIADSVGALRSRMDACFADAEESPAYNREAVEQAIKQSERRGGKVSGKERQAIHALLKGRGDDASQRLCAILDSLDVLDARMDAYEDARSDAVDRSQWKIQAGERKRAADIVDRYETKGYKNHDNIRELNDARAVLRRYEEADRRGEEFAKSLRK